MTSRAETSGWVKKRRTTGGSAELDGSGARSGIRALCSDAIRNGMTPKDVKGYLKRNKNDAADAAAICEAVRRPTMRFVRIKSAEQQGQLMQHRTRDVLIRQRTQIINALRAHLAELGIVAAQGDAGVNELRAIVADDRDERLPIDARASVIVLAAQLEALQTLIGSIEKRIKMQHRSNEASQRVETIPGIGVLGATAIVATAADPKG